MKKSLTKKLSDAMKRKKYRPSIFLKAEQRLKDGMANWCCDALHGVGANRSEKALFRRMFQPRGAPAFWFNHVTYGERQKARLAALRKAARRASEENKK